VIQALSREFKIQLILISAIPEIIGIADELITVKQTNGISEVV